MAAALERYPHVRAVVNWAPSLLLQLEAYVGGSYVQARARRELMAGARSMASDLAGAIDELAKPCVAAYWAPAWRHSALASFDRSPFRNQP